MTKQRLVTKKEMQEAFRKHELTETLSSLTRAHKLAYIYHKERGNTKRASYSGALPKSVKKTADKKLKLQKKRRKK